MRCKRCNIEVNITSSNFVPGRGHYCIDCSSDLSE